MEPDPSSRDIYRNPDLARHLDSFEGGVYLYSELPTRGASRASLQQRANQAFAQLGEILPGLVVAGGLAFAAAGASAWLGTSLLGFEKSPISAIMLTIAVGLLVRNTLGLPAVYDPGVRFCVRVLLRVGVALLGLRLSLSAVGSLGLVAIPIIAACIATALVGVRLLGRRLALSSRLTGLIAVGTSICGVSAIVATAPVLRADDDEVAYSVACITLFGMATLFAYPFLAHWLFAGDPVQIGLFLGTAIHDTAQVAGAGLVVQQQFALPEAMDGALVVKLVRNVSMVAVIPLLAVLHAREGGEAGETPRWHELIPFFVVGFVALVVVRTVGDLGTHAFGVLDRAVWQELLDGAAQAATWLLTLAMAGVGLGTRFSNLRELGMKPLGVGLVAALSIGLVSALLVRALV